jgi:hypothetical protein
MEDEEGFSEDYIVCDECDAPAPYRIRLDGRVIAVLCLDCRGRWWDEHWQMCFAAVDAIRELEEVQRRIPD